MNTRLSESRSRFHENAYTPVGVHPPEWRLQGRGIFFIGSCFADYLYDEYKTAELNAMNSPFGNIYNPESIAGAVSMLAGAGEEHPVKAEDCFNRDGETGDFRHFMFHSAKRASSAEELASSLNDEIRQAGEYIRTAEAAVLTLGTSLVFRLKSGRTVNNCHKLPASDFERIQLTPDEALASLVKAISGLQSINPDIKIILTLSPVRHLRDDAAENSLSKAVLRTAIGQVCKDSEGSGNGAGGSLWYFPSYEIMLDELRDYRWYADDLCHPSPSAVAYIISRFREAGYDDDYRKFLKNYDRVRRNLNHRPLNPDSDESRRFTEKAESDKEQLMRDYPMFFEKQHRP